MSERHIKIDCPMVHGSLTSSVTNISALNYQMTIRQKQSNRGNYKYFSIIALPFVLLGTYKALKSQICNDNHPVLN